MTSSNLLLAKAFLEEIPLSMGLIRRKMRALASPQLTVPEFRILAHLFNGPRSNQELAELQGVDSTTMTRLLLPLEERHLITKAADPRDRRRLRIALTPKGRTHFSSLRDTVAQDLSAAFALLTAKEKSQLTEAFGILKRVALQADEAPQEEIA